jgi:hypothetical protein
LLLLLEEKNKLQLTLAKVTALIQASKGKEMFSAGDGTLGCT